MNLPSGGRILSSSSSESISSVLSSPSYTVLETADGELITGLEENKLIWPQRPSVGRYSEKEQKDSKRHYKENWKCHQPTVYDEMVSAWQYPQKKHVQGSGIDVRTVYVVPSKLFGLGDQEWFSVVDTSCGHVSSGIFSSSQSSQKSSLLSSRQSFSSCLSLKDKDYVHLGLCHPLDVFDELDKVKAALFYELSEQEVQPLKLGLRFENKEKIILTVKKELLKNEEIVWGVADEGKRPRILFHRPEMMARFYSKYSEELKR